MNIQNSKLVILHDRTGKEIQFNDRRMIEYTIISMINSVVNRPLSVIDAGKEYYGLLNLAAGKPLLEGVDIGSTLSRNPIKLVKMLEGTDGTVIKEAENKASQIANIIMDKGDKDTSLTSSFFSYFLGELTPYMLNNNILIPCYDYRSPAVVIHNLVGKEDSLDTSSIDKIINTFKKIEVYLACLHNTNKIEEKRTVGKVGEKYRSKFKDILKNIARDKVPKRADMYDPKNIKHILDLYSLSEEFLREQCIEANKVNIEEIDKSINKIDKQENISKVLLTSEEGSEDNKDDYNLTINLTDTFKEDLRTIYESIEDKEQAFDLSLFIINYLRINSLMGDYTDTTTLFSKLDTGKSITTYSDLYEMLTSVTRDYLDTKSYLNEVSNKIPKSILQFSKNLLKQNT